MSSVGGPIISNNGLVFGYDTGYGITGITNTTRYNLGEPTTNEANTDISRTITFWVGTGSLYGTSERGSDWKKIIINETNTNHRILKFPYLNHLTGSTKTYQVEFDFNGLRDVGYYIKVDGYGGSGTTIYDGDFVHNTFTADNGGSGVSSIFVCNNTTSRTGLNDVMYYRNYQVQVKDHPTPFTPTSRSVSGSLLDLAGNTAIDLSNVSFDSNSQMYFSGSSTIQVPFDVATVDIPWTLECVFKRTASTGTHQSLMGNSGTSGTGTGKFLGVHSSGYPWSILYDGSGTQQQVSDTSTIMEYGKYYYLSLTHDGVTAKMYYNGNLIKSVSISGFSPNPTPGNIFTIGKERNAYWPLYGEVPIAKIYSRDITAEEARQNYNAYKHRFNL